MKTLIATLLLTVLLPLDVFAQLERSNALEFAFELARAEREQTRALQALRGESSGVDVGTDLAESEELSAMKPAADREFQIVLVPTAQPARP